MPVNGLTSRKGPRPRSFARPLFLTYKRRFAVFFTYSGQTAGRARMLAVSWDRVLGAFSLMTSRKVPTRSGALRWVPLQKRTRSDVSIHHRDPVS